MDGGAFARRARNRTLLTLLLAGLAFGGAFVVSTWALRARGVFAPPAEEAPPVLAALPDFRFAERGGREIGLADLRGKVWVADFFFTSCPGPCPILTAKMKALQDALADEPDARLVSFTIDPGRDTSEKLREYADRHGADPERWLFLRSEDEETMLRFSAEGFKLAAGKVIAGEEGTGADDPFHSQRFSLVDREGRVRGSYDTLREGYREDLLRDLRALLREGPGA